MKYLGTICLVTIFFLQRNIVFSQETNISYVSIPSQLPRICFFNTSPGPTNPTSIGGYNHYSVVGGVQYTGSSFLLPTDNIGGGTGYGIYYPFNQAYDYDISIKAQAPLSTLKLLWATSKYRSAVASSCSPGFPNIINSNPNKTGNITSLSSSFTSYSLVENYTPTVSDVNYLLFSGYNTSSVVSYIGIESVKITQKCKPPVITSVSALGSQQVSIALSHPNGATGVDKYTIFMARYEIVFVGPLPVLNILDTYPFPNQSTSGTITLTLPQVGNYFVYAYGQCTSGLNSKVSTQSSVVVY